MSSPWARCGRRLAELPGGAGDAGGADEVGDLVESDVFGAAEHDQHVGEPEQGAGVGLAEDRGQLPPGLRRR